MAEVEFEKYNEVAVAVDSDAKQAEHDEKIASSRIIYATTLQLGVDVLRELYDCGNLVTSVKEEQMNMNGVRALLQRAVDINI